MRQINWITGLAILVMALTNLSACKKEDQKSGKGKWVPTEEAATLDQQVLLLRDSVESLKRQAFASESEKIRSSEMWLDEVSNVVANYDMAKWGEIKSLRENVVALAYTEATMSDLAAMEKYDNACEQMVAAIQDFVTETPDINKYARANLLASDIVAANASDFNIRKDYNVYVAQFNNLLQDHGDEIKELGAQFADLKAYPLFYGEPEM
jgi:hypothetical protein